MFETGKSSARRNYDARFARMYFIGNGIDIGAGSDPLSNYREFYPMMHSCRSWDVDDGDGMLLDTIEDESFDFVHSSHCLEHLKNPTIALDNWIRVCKKGGHIVFTIPDEDLFEQGFWPSKYSNQTHFTSWTIGKHSSWSSESRNVIDFLKQFVNKVEIQKIELINSNFFYHIYKLDQSAMLLPECAIEIVLRKRTQEEIDAKGRLNQNPPEEILTIKTG